MIFSNPIQRGCAPERARPWVTGLRGYNAQRCGRGEARLLPPLLPSEIWPGRDWPSLTTPRARSTRARGLEPLLSVIYSAPVPPRRLHSGALRGGCDSLIKGQVHIFPRVHRGPRWPLRKNSSPPLSRLQKFSRRREAFIGFHSACSRCRPQRGVRRATRRSGPRQTGTAPTPSLGTAALARQAHGPLSKNLILDADIVPLSAGASNV